MLVGVGKIRVGKSIPHNRSLTKTFLSNGREVAFGLEFEFGSCLKFADTRMLATCLVLYQKRHSFPGIKRILPKRALLFGLRKYHCNSPIDKDFGWINENDLVRYIHSFGEMSPVFYGSGWKSGTLEAKACVYDTLKLWRPHSNVR